MWVHYAATKIGRGELFECIDALAYLRAAVFGPLLAVQAGHRPQGVRRLETYAGQALTELERTIGEHTRQGCIAALRAAIDLYLRLRDEVGDHELVRRARAEAASLDYLGEIEEAAG